MGVTLVAIPGTNVAAPLAPFDSADEFPTHSAEYGKGGWREVDTIADRDAIPELRRSTGMIVYVREDSTAYQLVGVDAWEVFEGGGGGASYAEDVAYNNAGFTNVKEALDSLFYTPPQITSFTNNRGTMEIGSSVADVTLSWSYNKDEVSQSINQGVGDLVVGDRSETVAGPFTADRTWTLTMSDGEQTRQASTSIAFRRRRYWGVSALTTLNNAQILALGGSEFATSFGKAITYNASGGRYPYYAYPASFGVPSSVTVGGLAFSDFTVSVVSLTNASGHTEDYNVIRFNNIQTGAAISVVWA